MPRSIQAVGEQSYTGLCCYLRRFLFEIKKAEVVILPLALDLCPPLTGTFIPGDAPIPGRRALVARPIVVVPSRRQNPEVRAATVETIPVPVVYLDSVTRTQAEDLSLKTEGAARSLLPARTNGVSVDVKLPPPSVQPVGVAYVYHDVGADRTIAGSEWDAYGRIGGASIKAHREASLPGVVPPAADNSAGVSCVNCISSLRVEAA